MNISWSGTASAIVAVIASGLLTWLILAAGARLPGRPGRYVGRFRRTAGKASIATVMVSTALTVLPLTAVPTEVAEPAIRRLLILLLVGCAAWLVVQILVLVELYAYSRLPVDIADNRRTRSARTRVTLIRRILSAVAVVVAIAVVLMSFQSFRTLGVSLLASAGVVGIVAGLAAQTTLGNVFSGLQLAFSDALRIDDVVVVEGEWGKIEEITLTYVVVRIWDERRLVLPTVHFTTTPFENWTRNESRVTGAVELHLDYTTPLPELRRRAQQVIETSPLWDKREWVMQVTDCTPSTMVVRILASAHDAPTVWNLRCDIREQLLTWLQATHPQSLPTLRVLHATQSAEVPLAR